MSLKFLLVNKTRSEIPFIRFDEIKLAALGPDYSLSLVIASSAKIKELNRKYRNKNTPTDILSFPISENEGEIYISPAETRKMAKKFGRKYENFFAFLFIHGCVHLKGYDHGSTMDKVEARLRAKFRI